VLRLPGLAGEHVSAVDFLLSDGSAKKRGDEHEGDPAPDGGLAVVGTPVGGPCGEVARLRHGDSPSWIKTLAHSFNFYATTEGLYGHDCAKGSMHLFDDMCIVENVDEDNRPVPAGEVGARLLVTNLFNHVQPLIRFEIADLVAFDPEPCPCGPTLARVRSLEGRAEEVLEVGGVTVHPMQFALVTADPDVREFQVVQERDALRLRVALRNGSDGAPERLRERLSGRLYDLGVASCPVTVETVDALERSAGGKLQMIVPRRESIRG
jgi:phenylacetate-CoA ligase